MKEGVTGLLPVGKRLCRSAGALRTLCSLGRSEVRLRSTRERKACEAQGSIQNAPAP